MANCLLRSAPISGRPWRTNGGLTTRAAQRLAANLDLHRARRVPRGTRASAMERSRVGENVPLVTSPGPATVITGWWLRSTPRSSSSSPTSSRSPAGARRLQRPASDEVAVLRLEGHGPAEAGLERIDGSRPCRCRTDSCPPPVAAYRARPAPRRRRRRRAAPARFAAHRPRQRDLEAILAGVAGARDEPVAEGGAVEAGRGRARAAASGGENSAPLLARAFGPCTRSSPDPCARAR